MKIRRYLAPDMRTALAKAREEQGAEVMILSNRSIEGGVELITGDGAGPLPEPDALPRNPPAHGAGPAPDPAVSEVFWTREPVLDAMRDELASLRRLVESQLAGIAWGDMARHHPVRAQVLRRLVGLGFEPRLASALVAAVPPDLDLAQGWRRALALVARRIRIGADRILSEGGRYALVGPTGVGKTTVIAKLAARAALRHGGDAVAVIAADDRRIGAHEQLKGYGRILGVAVWTANGAEDLRRALDAASGRRLVLVDTPGIGGTPAGFAQLAALLGASASSLDVVSVFAAVTQGAALAHAIRAHAALAPIGCIVTKLDECASLGGLIGAVIEAQLPVLHTTAGQRIPEDLDTISAAQFVARAVGLGAAHGEPIDDAILESAFAEGESRAFH
jgi:flagellar biosynthesis protein FlhF